MLEYGFSAIETRAQRIFLSRLVVTSRYADKACKAPEASLFISKSKGERIGIAWGTSFFDAGAMRLGIHESLIV